MKEGSYLAFGFALLFILERGGSRPDLRKNFEFYAKLLLAVAALVTIDTLFSSLLWNRAGREDLRFLSLFLWALLIERGRNRPFFLALAGFSVWAVSTKHPLWGLGLVPLTGIFEVLLEGLRDRLQLSNIPQALRGAPLLFWVAAILSLAFWGLFRGIGGHL